MKLFQRIFATFCAVIICAIFVASFSFWLVQNTLAENQFNQRRTIETTLMGSMVSAFRSRGDSGAREILNEWKDNPVSDAVFVILDDDNKDILDRDIDEQTIKRARAFAINNPNSDLARIEYGRFGEEYLFFIRDWDNQQAKRLPSPLFIPGLPLAPIWHEFIILSFIIIVGLIQAQPQKQEQYLKRLEGELTRMDTLVGELLTLSRLETSNVPLEKESLALVPFLTNLVEDCQAIAQQNKQTVSLHIDAKVPQTATIMANESYLYRAFDNVIRNAMNYSPEGSTISVNIKQDSKHWLIDVTDNGPGVDEMQLPHIFTAFYRADSSASKPGTGLGLALTQHIMEQHCGKIIAENVKPNGLRMHFVLPKK